MTLFPRNITLCRLLDVYRKGGGEGVLAELADPSGDEGEEGAVHQYQGGGREVAQQHPQQQQQQRPRTLVEAEVCKVAHCLKFISLTCSSTILILIG